MLTALVAVLLASPPVCSDEPHFSWASSALPGLLAGAIQRRAFAWVPAARDSFVMELGGGDRVLVGQQDGSAAIRDVTGWERKATEILLPLDQKNVVLTPWGLGVGCKVTSKGIDLGGPIPANVKLDARKKWRFEVRDRSMKEVLLSF